MATNSELDRQRLSEIKSIFSDAKQTGRKLSKKQSEIEDIIHNLDIFRSDVASIIKEYRTEKKKISQKLERIRTFYTNHFQPLQSKINDKSSGLKKTLSEANKFCNELDRKKTRLAEVNSEFNSILKTIRKKTKSINSIDKTALKHKKSIEDSLNEILKYSSDAKMFVSSMQSNLKEIKTSHLEIDEILKNSKVHFDKILFLEKESEESKNKIDELLSESSETNDKISNLYEIATNKTMAGAFDVRRKSLSIELEKWHKRVLVVSIIWLILILGIFVFQVFANKWSIQGLSYEFYLRFLYTAPIAYYLVFCVSQFNTIRKSHERYAFKTTIALSIEAHTDLLHRNFDLATYQKDILDFSLESLKKIYDEPFYLERAKEKVDLKKHESKNNQKGFSPLELWANKDNELYKLFNKVLDKTMPKDS